MNLSVIFSKAERLTCAKRVLRSVIGRFFTPGQPPLIMMKSWKECRQANQKKYLQKSKWSVKPHLSDYAEAREATKRRDLLLCQVELRRGVGAAQLLVAVANAVD